jgi:hypothetical protein
MNCIQGQEEWDEATNEFVSVTGSFCFGVAHLRLTRSAHSPTTHIFFSSSFRLASLGLRGIMASSLQGFKPPYEGLRARPGVPRLGFPAFILPAVSNISMHRSVKLTRIFRHSLHLQGRAACGSAGSLLLFRFCSRRPERIASITRTGECPWGFIPSSGGRVSPLLLPDPSGRPPRMEITWRLVSDPEPSGPVPCVALTAYIPPCSLFGRDSPTDHCVFHTPLVPGSGASRPSKSSGRR